MLRFAACLCFVLLLSSCEKNWRGLVIEKRVYREGYYVHVPWRRYTPVNEYPKPERNTVQTSRTDSTTTKTDSAATVAAASGTRTTNAKTAPPLPDNGSGTIAQNTSGTAPAPPVAHYTPAPPLQPLPETSTPPLPPPPGVNPPPAPPDSVIAANDSTPPTPADTVVARDRSLHFPEGEAALVTELAFYNPVYTGGIATKPFSYNAGLALRYTMPLTERHRISTEAGLCFSHFFIAQDQHKYEPMFMERHDRERMLQCRSHLLLMDHIRFTQKENARFNTLGWGVFADIGFLSTHVAVDYSKDDARAAFARNKTRLFGLNYLRTFQYGLTARIANDVWSVFASYRFSQMVKADAAGADLPRLTIGVTFALN